METIWFKRIRYIKNGFIIYETEYFKDYQCTNFICRDPYKARRRDHEVTLNGVKYYALRKIEDL